MSVGEVCAKCGVTIGPGEYKLRVRALAPVIDVEGPDDEVETWVCRRCASRLFLDDDEDDEAG
jgi:hypothetical protein